MTLNDIVDQIAEAARLAKNPSPVLRERAAAILVRCERAVQAGARLDPEITCAACERDGRGWFATAVAHGDLWPLCSRACVTYWLQHRVGRVFVGYGREWQEQLLAAGARG